MGVNAWTDMVTVVEEDAYASSGLRSSGMIWQCWHARTGIRARPTQNGGDAR